MSPKGRIGPEISISHAKIEKKFPPRGWGYADLGPLEKAMIGSIRNAFNDKDLEFIRFRFDQLGTAPISGNFKFHLNDETITQQAVASLFP